MPWSALLSPYSVPEAARAAAIVPSTQGAPFSTVFHARSSLSLHSLSLSTFSLAPSLSPNPAFDMGAIMNLDDASLVASVVEARGRCPELISFRLNPGLGRTDSETKSNVLGGPDAKFGVPPDQIVGAYVLTTK